MNILFYGSCIMFTYFLEGTKIMLYCGVIFDFTTH
jgi:hypothetical protein